MLLSKEDLFNNILKCEEAAYYSALEDRYTSYHTFEIPKKNGKRIINALDSDSQLFWIQKNIYQNLILKMSHPVCVKGFVKGESFKTFLAPHQGNFYFLQIDIKDFFYSIKSSHVKEMLEDIIPKSNAKKEIISIICELCTFNGVLPQGAVTSPGISNLVFARLDQRILKYCQIFSIEYTRYADDLLFSSYNFNFKNNSWFLKKIKFILLSKSFRLNYSKKKVSEKQISLNGFVISDIIRLSRKRFIDIHSVLRCVRNELHILKTGNKTEFLNIINNLELKYRNLNTSPFSSLSKLIQYLSGYRSYFISWLDDFESNSSGQKKLRKTIRKIEKSIIDIERAL